MFQEPLNHFFGHLFFQKVLNVGVPLNTRWAPSKAGQLLSAGLSTPRCSKTKTKKQNQFSLLLRLFCWCFYSNKGAYLELAQEFEISVPLTSAPSHAPPKLPDLLHEFLREIQASKRGRCLLPRCKLTFLATDYLGFALGLLQGSHSLLTRKVHASPTSGTTCKGY